MKIQRHGRYFELDESGLLRNEASLAAIAPDLRAAPGLVVEAYLARYGEAVHSVYLRGSVPLGLSVPGLSDLDTMAVMQPGCCPEEPDEEWESEAEERLLAALPTLAGVELFCVPLEVVRLHHHQLAFTLATQGLCVHGEDATRGLPGYRIDERLAFNARTLAEDLESYAEQDPHEDEVGKRLGLAWIAKRFLRVGMELTMVREQRYSRALYLCYESFVRHYAHLQSDMWRALEMALDPDPSPLASDWVGEFGSVLVAECAARLSVASE